MSTISADRMRKSFRRPSLDLVLIRQATPDDLAAIQKLEQRSATAAHWAAREYDALFAPDAPPRLALVAIDEADAQHIFGFVIARGTCEDWEIENVVVALDRQRRGVGSALIGELLRRALASGATWVLLEVRESNVPAIQLYEKIGFSEVGRRA